MTVRELIEVLAKMPPEAEVIYRNCRSYRSPTMDELKQREIDAMMLEKFDATRSSVTDEKWVKTASGNPGCWVCAYCRFSPNERGRSTLYMVHWTRWQGVTEGNAVVIYQSLYTLEQVDSSHQP